MADGQAHDTDAFGVDDPASIDEAIRELEAGKRVGPAGVDLGGGCIARPDGPGGTAGLLQRLKAHRKLLALAQSGEAPKSVQFEVTVTPEVKSLLDAVKNAR